MASYRPGPSLVATRPFTSTDKYPFVRFVFWSVAPLSQKPYFSSFIQVFESPEKTKFFGAFLFGAPIKRYGLWGFLSGSPKSGTLYGVSFREPCLFVALVRGSPLLPITTQETPLNAFRQAVQRRSPVAVRF